MQLKRELRVQNLLNEKSQTKSSKTRQVKLTHQDFFSYNTVAANVYQ